MTAISLQEHLAQSNAGELEKLKTLSASRESGAARAPRPKDPRFLHIALDGGKKGDNTIVLRFLPSKTKGSAIVSRIFHSFKNKVSGRNGQVYENSYYAPCRKTLGKSEPCPVCDVRWAHWKKIQADGMTREEAGKDEFFRDLRDQNEYFANVFVQSDTVDPTNNGKVLMLKFKTQIWDKYQEKFEIDQVELDAGVRPIIPHDLKEGAFFVLKASTGNGPMPQYDKSYFLPPAPLTTDDAKLETIWNSMHDIESMVGEEAFARGYEGDKKSLEYVLGIRTDGAAEPREYNIPKEQAAPAAEKPWRGTDPGKLAQKSSESPASTPAPIPAPANIPATPTPSNEDVDAFFGPKKK